MSTDATGRSREDKFLYFQNQWARYTGPSLKRCYRYASAEERRIHLARDPVAVRARRYQSRGCGLFHHPALPACAWLCTEGVVAEFNWIQLLYISVTARPMDNYKMRTLAIT